MTLVYSHAIVPELYGIQGHAKFSVSFSMALEAKLRFDFPWRIIIYMNCTSFLVCRSVCHGKGAVHGPLV